MNKAILKFSKMTSALALTVFLVSGCNTLPLNDRSGSSSSNSPSVGPLAGVVNSRSQQVIDPNAPQQVRQNQDVLLSVAVPEFDEGFAKTSTGEIDYDKTTEEGIWPQLRRTESKKFSFKTKQAIEQTGAFGAVSVTPDTTAPADLFVLGKILESDSQTVRVEITVQSVSGKVLGRSKIEHTVAEGYLTDRYNDGKNTYGPLFTKIAAYVQRVVSKIGTQDRLAIQELGKVAYAAKYSPESYMSYIQFNGDNTMQMTGSPTANTPMMGRIDKLRNHEYMFLDRLQEQYAAFDKDTEASYQAWQRTTLAEVKKREEARNRKIGSVLVGIVGAALAVNANKRNSGAGDAVRDIAVLGTVAAAVSAVSASREQAEQEEVINEMGEAADLEMSPMEMEFEGQTTKLQGTASEQYTQWRNHLKKIHQLENSDNKTPPIK